MITPYDRFKSGDSLSDQDLKDLIRFAEDVKAMLGNHPKFTFMFDDLNNVAYRCAEFQRAR